MIYNIHDIGGETVKNDDTYVVKDNVTLKNLVVSSTKLRMRKSTRGHSHPGQEEVYFFISGSGDMELGDKKIEVNAGDVVLVEDGVFHRVHNSGHQNLYFVCVFQGKRNH